MNVTGERFHPPEHEPAPRYCGACGEIFAEPAERCPNCAERWPFSTHLQVQPLATMLTEFRGLHDAHAISGTCYATLRRIYERRLLAIRPPRHPIPTAPPAPVPEMAATAAAPALPLPARSAPPPVPSRRPRGKPAGAVLTEWTAARQADILLYVGAFFLVIAALIFVGYQGEALGGPARFGLLVAYTGGFLAMGLLLPRWERVREAGAIFLGLGAVLVPVCFIAFRTQVLGGDVPVSGIWLAGSVVSAALYFGLAARGYGRLYAVPGALAVLLAWGSLGVVLRLPAGWFGAWFVGGVAAVHLVSFGRPLPAMRWVDLATWITGAAGLLYAHIVALGALVHPAQLPMTYTFATLAVVAELWQRGTFRAKGALPVLTALTGLTAAWAAFDLRVEWYGSFAVAGLGYLIIAELDVRRRDSWRQAAGLAGLAGLFWAHVAALNAEANPWQLPLTYGLVLAGVLWDNARRQDVGLLALPPALALFGASVLWASGVAVVWWAYPGLAACTFVLLSEPWWRGRPVLAETGWPYLLIATLVVPLVPLNRYTEAPAHGMVAFALASGIFLASALRVCGALGRLAVPQPDARALLVERQMLARLSGMYLFAAAWFFNGWAGLEGEHRAWVYAAIGTAAWLGLVAVAKRWRGLMGIVAPMGAVALALATWIARANVVMATVLLTLGAVGPALAFRSVRWWPLWGIAMSNGLLAVAAGSAWIGLERTLLPLAYAGIGAATWAGLLPLRRNEQNERGWWITGLSWVAWMVAGGLAFSLLREREQLLLATPLARTREWVVQALVLAAGSALMVAEGVRLRLRWLWTAGSAGLLAALLMGIAITEPGNVQVYTLPVGVYLLALGLSYRRSPSFFGPHMVMHEAVIVAGLLVMVLPPAAQSFAPGGGRYGLELIAGGLVFLVLGFVLVSRWLAVGGVLTLTGVAVRWLFLFSTAVPYWLTLALAGMALIAVGLLLLLERERWDRTRARIARWWQEFSVESSGTEARGPV